MKTVLRALRPSVALALVAVSVLGTLSAFYDTRASADADLETTIYLADLTIDEEVGGIASELASADLGTFAEYQLQQLQATELEVAAEALAATDPVEAQRLRAQAATLRGLLRSDSFILTDPRPGFDELDPRATLTHATEILRGISPPTNAELHKARADDLDDLARDMRMATVLFAAAFFGLSIAEIASGRFRGLLAAGAACPALAAVVVWVAAT